MKIQDKISTQEFKGLKIKKNILKDLDNICTNHEKLLRQNVNGRDEFVSNYGMVLPKRMLQKVADNQKKNKITDIVFGYFRFGLNPFKKKEAGIAIQKGHKTLLKEKLDTSVYFEKKQELAVDFSGYKVRSNLYDKFSQAEDIANHIEKFSQKL